MKLSISSDSGKSLPRVLATASTLIVSKRKQISPKKPENFLVAVMPDNSREYISSLFPTSRPGQFRFDYQGQGFRLVHGEGHQVHVIPD